MTDHEALEILATSGERIVMRSRQARRTCHTMMFLRPVDAEWDRVVREACAGSPWSVELPESLTRLLEGYRVRATLGSMAGLPEVIAGGVTRRVPDGVVTPAQGYGYAYVSREWVDGSSLEDAASALTSADELEVLHGVLGLLAEIHARGGVYGALTPGDVIVTRAGPALVGLAGLRTVSPEAHAAGDVHAWWDLAKWLLERKRQQPEGATQVAAWVARMEDRLRGGEAAHAGVLLAAWAAAGASEGPVTVPDQPTHGASPRPASAQDTIRIGDEDEPSHAVERASAEETMVDPEGPSGPGSGRASAQETIVVPDDPPGPGSGRASAQETIVVPDDPPGPGSGRASAQETIVVPDDAPEPRSGRASAQETIVVPDDDDPGPPAGAPAASNALLVAVAIAAVLVALVLVAVGSALVIAHLWRTVGEPEQAAAGPSVDPSSHAFARCEGDPPTSVVLAELRPGTPVPASDEMRSWFPGVPHDAILVYRLARQDPRTGSETRAVTFELTRASWPEWGQIAAGASGEELCGRLARALEGRLGDRSRPLQFHAGRQPGPQVQPSGTATDLGAGGTRAAILDWLEPLEIRARCSHRNDRGGGTLTITCNVVNTRSEPSQVRVMPTLYRAERGEPVHREQLTLAPGERAVRRYRLRGAGVGRDSRCGCDVVTTP